MVALENLIHILGAATDVSFLLNSTYLEMCGVRRHRQDFAILCWELFVLYVASSCRLEPVEGFASILR